jgi:hypothetical protein
LCVWLRRATCAAGTPADALPLRNPHVRSRPALQRFDAGALAAVLAACPALQTLELPPTIVGVRSAHAPRWGSEAEGDAGEEGLFRILRCARGCMPSRVTRLWCLNVPLTLPCLASPNSTPPHHTAGSTRSSCSTCCRPGRMSRASACATCAPSPTCAPLMWAQRTPSCRCGAGASARFVGRCTPGGGAAVA